MFKVRQYEVMYVLRPDLEEEENKQLVERISKIVTDGGGEIRDTNHWGMRRLAYEIDHLREGYYVLMKCHAEHSVAQELDRVFRITDGVLRYIIIREDQ